MKISKQKLEELCRKKGLRIRDLLARSGVSKTAYYNLLYKENLLPKSLYSIADILGVSPSAFIDDISSGENDYYRILRMTNEIIKSHPKADRDNVRHTLILLKEDPVERLRRGLRRGRQFNILRK